MKYVNLSDCYAIFSSSLRVNLDIGKAFYSWMMQRDKEMPDTVVRSTTIPEELGRISYLLSDKTGTLTQNDMVFKRLHLGTASYTHDSFDQVSYESVYTYVILHSLFLSTISADRCSHTGISQNFCAYSLPHAT